jgi:hypothetical protein
VVVRVSVRVRVRDSVRVRVRVRAWARARARASVREGGLGQVLHVHLGGVARRVREGYGQGQG